MRKEVPEKALDLIEELYELTFPDIQFIRWISVDMYLPRDDGQYLVDGPHGFQIATWNGESDCWDDADGDDYWHDPKGWFTHWAKIPEVRG